MDNELNSNFAPSSNTQGIVTDPTPPPMGPSLPPHESRNLKPLVIILSIFSVVALIVAAVFACLYFTKNTVPVTIPEPQTPVVDEPTGEEVEITDAYVLRDLDEKMAILHLTDQTSPTIIIEANGSTHPEFALYHDGTLSDAAKLAHIISSLNLRQLSHDESQAAITQYFPESERSAYQGTQLKGVDAETVIEKYRDVFGQELKPTESNPTQFAYCPNYVYNSEYNLYFDWSMCGGTSPYDGYYYKNKYTTDGEHAYVYVNAAVVDKETSQVYCDVTDYPISSADVACNTLTDATSFALDESNHQNFAEYRFAFKEANDGTYFFEKVEKLPLE